MNNPEIRCWRVKLPNRRVKVGFIPEHKKYEVRMKILTRDRKIKRTEFTLSPEAAEALLQCIAKAREDEIRERT